MIQQLVVNSSLLISSLFILSILFNKAASFTKHIFLSVLTYGVGFGLLGILLMQFTIPISDHVIMDLRIIAILLPIYYYGTSPGIVAAVIIASGRVLMFGVNQASIVSVVYILLVTIGCCLFHRWLQGSVRIQWWLMNLYSLCLTAGSYHFLLPDKGLALRVTALYSAFYLPIGLLSYYFIYYLQSSNRNAKELLQKQQKLEHIFDHVDTVIWSWNPTSGEKSISKQIETISGYPRERFLTDSDLWHSILHPDDAKTHEAFWNKICLGSRLQRESRITHADGHVIWVQEAFRPIMDTNGKLTKVIGVIYDITARKEAEHALLLSRNKLSTTLDSIGDGVISSDPCGRIRYLNPVAIELTKWSAADAIGQPIENVLVLVNEQTGASVVNPIHQAVRENRIVELPQHTMLVNRFGVETPIDDSASPIRDENGTVTGVVLVFRDIQQRKQHEEQIKHYAFHDSLTGLPNRRYFREKLADHLINCQSSNNSMAVMFLDLDQFKMINDSHGHETGDLLLIEVASRLRSCIRKQDVVSRLGGDEFTIIMSGVSMREAGEYARYMKQSLCKKFNINGNLCFTAPSIGISMYPEDGDDVDTLIKCADTAMYHVKLNGKNHFRFYASDMKEKILRRLEIDKGLREALETDSLRLEYQPKVDLLTGKLTGFEALLRWSHPEWGNVSPDEFIPVAEESGLIIQLGEWVLRTACRQFRKWLDSGDPGERLAVNLSVKQLQDPGLPVMLERILEEEKFDPSRLELEITESIMKEGEHTVRSLKLLKDMGIYISIDDFGTGYSSLSYLNRLPIDALKIDKSFIRDIFSNNSTDAEIVTTIIAMAKSLNLKVIAEGVETIEQLDFLKLNNCHEGQGYLIGRPTRPESIEEAFIVA
ncbi:MAG: EAL domain-containing protein, partial [Gorillibacterium sp.]|nr:EAL domain-containing protein [Gorillibacterium sp.]